MSCHIVAWSLFQNITQKYDKLMEANEIFFSVAVTAPMRKSFRFYNSTGEDLPAGLPASKYSSDLLKACEDHFSRIYPDFVNAINHETVVCPLAFSFEYIPPTGETTGAIRLTEIEREY